MAQMTITVLLLDFILIHQKQKCHMTL